MQVVADVNQMENKPTGKIHKTKKLTLLKRKKERKDVNSQNKE